MNLKIYSVVLLIIAVPLTLSYSQSPLSISLTAGVSSPAGGFSDVYKSGASIEGVLLYKTNYPGLEITLAGSYNSYKYKNEYFTDLIKKNFSNVTAVTGFYVNWTAADIPIMAGARYYFSESEFRPYATAEIGLHYMTFDERFDGRRVLFSSTDPVKFDSTNNVFESGSETGFGFAIGAGIQFNVAKNLFLDFGFKYNYAGITYSKQFEAFRNNNDSFTAPELKNASFITARLGFLLKL